MTTKIADSLRPHDMPLTPEEWLRASQNRADSEVVAARAALRGQLPAPRPLPSGKTLEDVIVGALPDNKTDAEVDAALRDMD